MQGIEDRLDEAEVRLGRFEKVVAERFETFETRRASLEGSNWNKATRMASLEDSNLNKAARLAFLERSRFVNESRFARLEAGMERV